MPAEIVTAGFCADYFAIFEVTGSKGDIYRVELFGMDGHCSCPAWKYRKDCKHMQYVWDHACLWNPQWYSGGADDLQPVEYLDEDRHFGECPHCSGPMVPVRIAV